MEETHKKPLKTHHGVIVPVITPVTDKTELDENSFRKLIDFLIDSGVHGVFVLGSIGEGPSVPRGMRARIVHLAMEQVRGRARVYAGILDNTTIDAAASAREYLRMGISGVVAQLPNYFSLTPGEQFRYFVGLVERVQGPILLYEIPATVHMSLDMGVIEHLRAFPNVVGIKDASGDPERVKSLLESYRDDPGFSVLIGTTRMFNTSLRFGADGIVPGLANLEPALCTRMYASSRKGDWLLMNELQAEMEKIAQNFLVPNYLGQSIARLKWMMSQRGQCTPVVLPPLQPYTGT